MELSWTLDSLKINLVIFRTVFILNVRVAELVRGHGRHPPKIFDSDENFKPKHMLFCRNSRFVAIYALFGDFWAKKSLFGSKTVFFGQEVQYYMVYNILHILLS